jgi:DNA-binding beta-propeller fold protein YncE
MRQLSSVMLVGIAVAARLLAVEPPARIFELATDSAPLALAANPTTGKVFSLDTGQLLTVIDEVTRRRSLLAVAPGSGAIAADSETGWVYVTGIGNFYPYTGQMTALDPTTGDSTVVEALYLGSPSVNSITNRVYVTMPDFARYPFGTGFHTIAVFDGATLARHDVTITGPRSQALAVDELHDRIYVATLTDSSLSPTPLTVVNGQTEQTTDVSIGCQSSNVVADPSRSRAWVGCYDSPKIIMVEGDALAAEFPLDGTPKYIAVNPTTGRLYVALDYHDSLIEIDPDAGPNPGKTRQILLPEPATGLAVNPQTNTIYAIHASASTVTLVDGDSHDSIEVEVGSGASAVVVDATRDITWIATAVGVTGLYGPTAPCSRCTRDVYRP